VTGGAPAEGVVRRLSEGQPPYGAGPGPHWPAPGHPAKSSRRALQGRRVVAGSLIRFAREAQT